MKAKKWIALLLAAVCVCTLLAACGNKTGPTDPTDGLANVKTIGDALDLNDKSEEQYALADNTYVYVFRQGETYWRLSAELTQEQSEALWALEYDDPDYDTKYNELVAPLAVTKCENLNELKLSGDEMQALVGKTGADLLADGFITGMGYDLDTMTFFMERPPFAYSVLFESDETLENTDDFDETEAIRPLKVKSVVFDGLGNTATDLPTDGEGEDTEDYGIDYLVLVNKQNPLPEDWEATVELVEATNTIPEGVELNEDNDYLASYVFMVEKNALAAFRELQADLEAEGIIILLDSTYRSVARQEELWAEFVEKYGEEYTKNPVAVPGTSEHHTGLAIDVCLVKDGVVINENDDMIAERQIFSKIHEKLADYGFILRFPEGGKEITGYDYEPWHFRYVGVEAAQEIAEQGVTLEEYLGEAPEEAK